MTTPFHSQYWAHELTLRGATGSIEYLSRSIASARVDLNPHQVDAALFALRSPLMRGAVLADEVGLGKTIEAGIVIAQRWAERKRRILLIVPATLRKQWQQELESKFYVPVTIIDTRIYNELLNTGHGDPFAFEGRIIICSYYFASAKAQEIKSLPWDLVVIDEAHRLRNVFRKSSKLAKQIVEAVSQAPKLLLTATPLQNSLMELYGLASVIDEHIFGDAATFRDQFVRAINERERNAELRERLRPICIRTLRKQVVEYIPFTRRIPLTQDFLPGDDEQALYEHISAYLQREGLIALPASQRTLITLVLRKLLASSTFAIANTLDCLIARLENLAQSQIDASKQADQKDSLLDDEDLEGVDEFQDEMEEQEEIAEEETVQAEASVDEEKLKAELAELRGFAALARAISLNAKGEALIPALDVALNRAEKLGAARKAVIFTESRRTQQYLFELLSVRGYQGQLVTINGSNNDPHSKAIYGQWRKIHQGQEIVTGSQAIDIKAAMVEQFRDRATILIATEAAAEGVNLQFCSLVVNYDLPWNPQRIEQRIGRCHRYGQKHDVVVVNFINRRNEADQRVFELLSEKFKLFDGVFGASDEVLGALESGVDIERRIAKVYQTCRNVEEIKAAFDRLQAELEEQIQARLTQTRELLLENLDEDVSARLRINRNKTLQTLSNRERFLLELTRNELDGEARLEDETPRFYYSGARAQPGWYHFDWKEAERLGDTFYRQDHPLASSLIEQAIARNLSPSVLILDYAAHRQVVSPLKPLVGTSGWLELSKLTVESLDTEEFLIFSGQLDNGDILDEEISRKLLLLPAGVDGTHPGDIPDFSAIRQTRVAEKVKQIEERNGKFFDEEVLKLDHWSDDLKQGLEREIKELDKQIREVRREAALVASLHNKLEAQKSLKALESIRNRKRRELFDAQDVIDAMRDELIGHIEKQLQQRLTSAPVFIFRWRIV